MDDYEFGVVSFFLFISIVVYIMRKSIASVRGLSRLLASQKPFSEAMSHKGIPPCNNINVPVSYIDAINRNTCLHSGVMSRMQRAYSSLPSHTKLGMPALSPTMSQGTLVEWKVQEGQEVAAGDLLADIETDKATLGWENQDDGVIARLLVPSGTQGIDVGQVVAIMVDDAEDVGAFKEYVVESDKAQEGDVTGDSMTQSSADLLSSNIPVRAGPAARILMELNKIDPSTLVPSGPKGIVTKGDVIEALLGGTKASPPEVIGGEKAIQEEKAGEAVVDSSNASEDVDEEGPEFIDIPTTNMRKVIAKRLLESKTTVPHMYISADIALDKIMAMRKSLAANGIKVSVNDCVLRAAALALEQVPSANAFWSEEKGHPVHAGAVDVCVAVATEGGLYTPIVKDANKKSLTQISADVRLLATKARENKLMPEEYQGGSFSVSNLGMFGVDSFSAIINPPQGAIMAVGGGRKVARMDSNGTPVAITEMTVTISADSRVFDGQTAADFLEAFKANMEDPFRLSIVL